MAERPVEDLTLREMFTTSERLVRELIEHVEKSFNPKVHDLEVLVRPPEDEDESPPQDVTVRSQVALMLDGDNFSQTLYKKLEELLLAIDRGAQQAINAVPRT